MSVVTKPDQAPAPVETVTLTIDGIEVTVPKGTLAIRAAETIGIAIPRFCDHPLLDPQGACRQCMVEIPDAGNGRGFPKPQASCTIEVAPGMKIQTQRTSEVAAKAQRGMLELLLINHPLDCPICDKGGECPLQNQAMSNGGGASRYNGVKRTYPKPVPISAQILLDRERCVLCARCTRFSEQIAGDPFIALVERGALQQVGRYADEPYDSYFSGNVVQICPVGALTSAAYRFQSRPFDLVSTDATCEHCAAGCQLRIDHRHGVVRRRLAGEAPAINEEWNCDKGRFAFVSGRGEDRLRTPLVRENGELRAASWPEAIDAAVAGLAAAGKKVGVLTGGRLTLEDSYGYAKFTRAVLGTNNIDFRARPVAEGEAAFLVHQVAGRTLGEGLTYTDLENAKNVFLVGFEPEEESPIVFLRLRKAVRKKGQSVTAVAPLLSAGNAKLKATLVPTLPGAEAEAVAGLKLAAGDVILVGERAALAPGALSAVVEAAEGSGARFAWVPRRAGDRGAIEAGCLPSLLPGARPVTDVAARVDVATAWGIESLPPLEGLEAPAMLAAAADGDLAALVIAGVELSDFADAQLARAAVEKVGFVVSLESRRSEVTEAADVVFPVALLEEHSGTFWNWEHRPGRVNTVIKQVNAPMTDLRVLAALADALGTPLGFRTAAQALAEFTELGTWDQPIKPEVASRTRGHAPKKAKAAAGDAVKLATWRMLLDGGRGQDGEEALAATAKPTVARLSPAQAAAVGVDTGDSVVVTSPAGWYELAVEVTESMVDGAVWVPTNSPGTPIGELGVVHGDDVVLSVGGAQ
ncbi:MAG: NADH-quinone oxidoreductase subunit G [Actinobacteria bacterium HGW-Actinobacteria-2]|nr:MAG: NADH-quinone oxidoreductase subunit G [Actinobacteria bacterium HGW-Actinobacteria-2]